MDWTQFGIMLVTFTGLFFWNRTESRADHRHMEATMTCMMNGIRDEMKDFHGRLERQDAEFKAHLMYQHKGKE